MKLTKELTGQMLEYLEKKMRSKLSQRAFSPEFSFLIGHYLQKSFDEVKNHLDKHIGKEVAIIQKQVQFLSEDMQSSYYYLPQYFMEERKYMFFTGDQTLTLKDSEFNIQKLDQKNKRNIETICIEFYKMHVEQAYRSIRHSLFSDEHKKILEIILK